MCKAFTVMDLNACNTGVFRQTVILCISTTTSLRFNLPFILMSCYTTVSWLFAETGFSRQVTSNSIPGFPHSVNLVFTVVPLAPHPYLHDSNG